MGSGSKSDSKEEGGEMRQLPLSRLWWPQGAEEEADCQLVGTEPHASVMGGEVS